jgi:transcriptional regulator with XRE-family HTH domain
MKYFDYFCQNNFCLMKSFGEIIRQAREEKNLILRQVGAELDIDQAIVSKFERGERKPTKEQVQKFADFYNLEIDKLLIAWLSDKVIYDLENEALAEEAIKVAEQRIKYQRTIKSNSNE